MSKPALYKSYRLVVAGVIGLTLMLVGLLWGAAAWESRHWEENRLEAEKLTIAGLSSVTAANLLRAIEHVDTGLQVMALAFRTTPDRLAETSSLLRRGPLGSMVTQIAVIGADGYLVFSDHPDSQRVYLGDREHFRVFAESSRNQLFVSDPVLGRVSQRWTLQFSRPIRDDKGRLLGVVVVSLIPRHLMNATLGVMPEENRVVTVMTASGTVLARSRENDSFLGRNLLPAEMSWLTGSHGERFFQSPLDGEERIYGYQRLKDYPLVVTVGIPAEGFRAEMQEVRAGHFGFAAAASLALLAFAVTLLGYLARKAEYARQLDQQHAHLREAQRVGRLGSWEWRSEGSRHGQRQTDSPGEGAALPRERGRLWWSDQVYEMFGVKPREFQPTHRGFLDRVHPDDRERVAEAIARAVETGVLHGLEHRIRRDDGSERVVVERAEIRVDESGWSLLGTVQDITDFKRLELALREAEERWKFALEGAGDGVWDWDLLSNTFYMSRRWKEMLGYGDKDISHLPAEWESRVHPEDRAGVTAALDAHLSQITPFFQAEYRLRCRTGDYRWVLSRGMVVRRDGGGRPLRLIGTNTDIHLRKGMEIDLVRSEDRLRQVLSVLHEGVLILDAEGRILSCNGAAAELLGGTTAAITGHSLENWDARAGDGSGVTWGPGSRPLERSLETGMACEGMLLGLLTPAGRRTWLRVSCHPLGEAGKPMGGDARVVLTLAAAEEPAGITRPGLPPPAGSSLPAATEPLQI